MVEGLTHSAHEGLDGITGQCLVTADSTVDILDLEVDVLELFLLIFSQRSNEVVDTWDQDLAFWRDQFGHYSSACTRLSEGILAH